MSQDNNYSRGPVPLAARKGVVPLTFVMLGLTFFPPVCGPEVRSVPVFPIMISSSQFSSAISSSVFTLLFLATLAHKPASQPIFLRVTRSV